jgi:diphthine-ammonia ligase
MTSASLPTSRFAVSWSGGKDSMLALVRTRGTAAEPPLLVTMFDQAGASRSHALPEVLLRAQAAALGAEWLAVAAPPDGYARAFDDALHAVRDRGIERMVFGDIDLQAHRDWIESACARAGVAPWFALWGEARAALAHEILARGIRACVVCVDRGRLGEAWCGRAYDHDFIASLPPGVCPCGEDGEFHTFVHDGPGFRAPLPILLDGVRVEPSRLPLRPTTFALCTPRLA